MSQFTHTTTGATPIVLLTPNGLKSWLGKQPATVRHWVEAHSFAAKPDTFITLPSKRGDVQTVLAGTDGSFHIWSIAHLPALLPTGTYKLQGDFSDEDLGEMALGFALAQYQFGRYRKVEKKRLTLALPKSVDTGAIMRRRDAFCFARDLINVPPQDMRPQELAKAAQEMARAYGAKVTQVVGDDLLKQNYPAIHAVGRAGPDAPRLIRLQWGNEKNPRVALIGKGVTFDTGGLDLKPLAAMRLMKKDMAGAATVLGLAQLIMAEKLPVFLDVLVPAVENAIDGNAYRPSDILPTRKGLTIEVGSTDAEGRIILADALAEADAHKPALMIDIATLTGAARTALGAELPALYSQNEKTGFDIVERGLKIKDPLWQMPLWPGYAKYVNSQVADITNSPNYTMAGSITAALFLQRFVSAKADWVHIDTGSWNYEQQPGRPIGGEAMCLRTLFSYIKERFAN